MLLLGDSWTKIVAERQCCGLGCNALKNIVVSGALSNFGQFGGPGTTKHGSEATNAETRSCIRRVSLGALREQSCGLSGMTFRTFAYACAPLL